jgi:hypothetical protein
MEQYVRATEELDPTEFAYPVAGRRGSGQLSTASVHSGDK